MRCKRKEKQRDEYFKLVARYATKVESALANVSWVSIQFSMPRFFPQLQQIKYTIILIPNLDKSVRVMFEVHVSS